MVGRCHAVSASLLAVGLFAEYARQVWCLSCENGATAKTVQLRHGATADRRTLRNAR
jgi:hypothetical protein